MNREQFLLDVREGFKTVKPTQKTVLSEKDGQICGCAIGAAYFHNFNFTKGFNKITIVERKYNLNSSYIDGIIDGFDESNEYSCYSNNLNNPDYEQGVKDGKELWETTTTQ